MRWVALVIVLGCGGSTAIDDGSGGGTGTGAGSGGSDGFCPASPPADGAPCVHPRPIDGGIDSKGAHCSWGDDPRIECRVAARCQEGSWIVSTPNCEGDPLLPAGCPSAEPEHLSACSQANLECYYQGSHCECNECEDGVSNPICYMIDPPLWRCYSPPEGCGEILPNAGDACSEEGKSCYSACDYIEGVEIVCEAGSWLWRPFGCPICAAPTTPIATPSGERPIAALRVGDLVYSVDGDAIVAVPIAQVGSTEVVRHQVARVVLNDGTVLEISPGHPTADGRTFADLETGDWLDQQRVREVTLVPYAHARTHDILPASDTGNYFAGGALIGSTLAGSR